MINTIINHTNEEVISDMYNSRPVNNKPCAESKNKFIPLTHEQKNALLKLRGIRDQFILYPHGLFYSSHPLHNNFVSYIKDRKLGEMLRKADLPYLNLESYENSIIEDTAFADTNTIKFEYIPGIKTTINRMNAKSIDTETMFYVIKDIQKYLYQIDKDYGTSYISIDNPDLKRVEQYFVKTVDCECCMVNAIEKMYEKELIYFSSWMRSKCHN